MSLKAVALYSIPTKICDSAKVKSCWDYKEKWIQWQNHDPFIVLLLDDE